MIKYQKDTDHVVTLTMDMSGRPVNIINHEVGKAFMPVLKHLLEEKAKNQLRGVILASAKKTYLAGGDLDYLYNETDPLAMFHYAENLKRFFRQLELPGVPVVAAMNGTALGSGFELPLACHYRIAVNNPHATFGNPEVGLGLMPGGGAVIRLMWMLGIEKALPILSEGKRYKVKEAFDLGLIHEIATDEEDMMERAKRWLLEHPNAKQPWDTEGGKIVGGGAGNPRTASFIAAATAQMVQKTRGNYPAVSAILNTMAEGSLVDFDTATRIESRYFASLVLRKETKNMTKAFWYDLNTINDGGHRPKGFGRFKARAIGVIGAGMMGSGIAYTAAAAGIKVVLKDVSKNVAELGKEFSAKILSAKVAKKEITEADKQAFLALITPTDKCEDFRDCDLVIEAVFENKDLKAKVTREAEQFLHRETFFATNTSSLPITKLAEASHNSQNYIGLHFFSPVDKMKLVEVIAGEKTSEETLARAIDFVHQIKKTPIVVRDAPGFYTTRVFRSYLLEGVAMLDEGIAATVIEHAGEQGGMPVGPLAQSDEVSLSLILDIEKQSGQMLPPHPAINLIDRMVNEFGRKGKGKGAGFYEYPKNEKKQFWSGLKEHFLGKNEGDFTTLIHRLMFIQCLETVRCLEEGVINHVADANIGSIYGWSFAPFKGGTLQYINDFGLTQFVARAEELAAAYGDRFNPPALLKEKASRGELF